MAEENTSEVEEIENCFDTSPPEMSEESSVETLLVRDVVNVEDVISVVSRSQEEFISEIKEVLKPQCVTLRRHSTGTIGTRASKPPLQSRYRGNHHVASTHDFCKHGKRCDQDNAVKPWKTVRRKSVEGSVTVKVETSSLKMKSLGSVSKIPESSVAAKRDALAVKRKPCDSSNSECSSKEGSEIARSVDGSSGKSSDKVRRNKEIESTLMSGSADVKKVPDLRNEKPNTAMEKISRINGAGGSKVCAPKNMEKEKTQTVSSEDVKEKTVCVVESSVKGFQSEKQPSSEKKTMRSGPKSSTTPKRGSAYHSTTKQIPSKISTDLTKKKESESADLEADLKPEKKIRPKRNGVKVNLARQLSFKRGKILEPKPENSSPKWIKFRERIEQEPKTQTEGGKKNLKGKRLDAETKRDSCEGSKREKVVLKHRQVEGKKNLKGKRLDAETKRDSCEGSKREKVVLKHRQVEGKKKMMTLFNNVIEETMNRLTKVRNNKVKALIGAFETVISLQDTKTSHKAQSKATTSASKVSPLASEQ